MHHRSCLVLLYLAATMTVIAAAGVSADTITVRQDGTGDHVTVAAALAASSPGDTVEVGPGTYAEPPLFVTHSLTIESTDGPAATTLDGQGTIRIVRFEGVGNTSVIDGIRFYNGNNVGVGSVTAVQSAHLTVRNCVFEGNLMASFAASNATAAIENSRFVSNPSGSHPGGVYVSGAGTSVSIADCEFTGNSTTLNGGALSVVAGASAIVTGCRFVDNQAYTHGSAINVGEGSALDVTGCLFANNTGGASGPIYHFRSSGTVENCTFYRNGNTDESYGSVLIHETANVSVYWNIFYEQSNGPGLTYRFGGGARGCNIFWGNEDGPIDGDTMAPDDVVANPLFCEAVARNFGVSALGPAAPAHSACGQLVGAFDPSCNVDPPPPPSDGTRITVHQDGTGDYLTVAEALAASTWGDTIEVGPGTYTEPSLIVPHSLTIESTDGPFATTLDGQGSIRILRFEGIGNVSVVDGIRFYRGNNPGYGSVTAVHNAQLTVRDCIFEGNLLGSLALAQNATGVIENSRFESNPAMYGAPGGVYVSGASVVITDCEFVDNSTNLYGGAISVVVGASAIVTGSRFFGNQADVHGSAINVGEGSALDVTGCLFANNTGGASGPIYHFRSSGTVENCTFYRNGNTDDSYGSVLIHETANVSVYRSIFYEQSNGPGLTYLFADGDRGCNIFWNNDDGPIDGASLAVADGVVDPVFCDAPGGDFSVSSLGPAAPGNSACGQLIGAFDPDCAIEPPAPLSDAPVIISVLDVPDDQGGQVRIKWLGSAQDAAGTEYTITGYAIYRHQETIAGSSPLMAPPPLDGPRGKGAQIDGWDYVVTVPARGDSVYQTTVATLCDARHDRPCSNAFFVSAMTPDPLTYFDSTPDSGYSVDNLPPDPPSNLVASAATPGIDLNWSAPDAPDIECYRIYRGTDPGFGPDEASLMAETPATEWSDATGSPLYQYKVTTIDTGGNEGEPATVSTSTTAGDAARVFSLDQNVPNPFNPTTVIPYTVGVGAGRIRLRVYDVAGRLVATLVDEIQSPGPKTVKWDGRGANGRPVVSGMYFYRLTGPGFEKTLKMTLVQ